jgi:hypothetical protein
MRRVRRAARGGLEGSPAASSNGVILEIVHLHVPVVAVPSVSRVVVVMPSREPRVVRARPAWAAPVTRRRSPRRSRPLAASGSSRPGAACRAVDTPVRAARRRRTLRWTPPSGARAAAANDHHDVAGIRRPGRRACLRLRRPIRCPACDAAAGSKPGPRRRYRRRSRPRWESPGGHAASRASAYSSRTRWIEIQPPACAACWCETGPVGWCPPPSGESPPRRSGSR